MKGIHCALQAGWARTWSFAGRKAGRTGAACPRASATAMTWVSVAVFEEKPLALAGLMKGAEVYVEGRLSLTTWTGKDATQRTGLLVAAWEVQPMGQIGRRKPKVQSRDEQPAVPLDDKLRF
jgi:single-stranded DNA-binding protein